MVYLAQPRFGCKGNSNRWQDGKPTASAGIGKSKHGPAILEGVWLEFLIKLACVVYCALDRKTKEASILSTCLGVHPLDFMADDGPLHVKWHLWQHHRFHTHMHPA